MNQPSLNLLGLKKIRCKHCKSRLKIIYDDLKMHYNTVDILTSYFFECPCCKENLEISLRAGKKLKRPNGSLLNKSSTYKRFWYN